MFEYQYLFCTFCIHRADILLYYWACVRGLSDVAELLINKGASFDVKDESKLLFLHK